MAEILFYHLSKRPLETALPDLLEKTLAKGWRAVVRCGSQERVEALDRLLWTYDEASFLPHGTSDAARQPILLTTGDAVPNGADLLFLLDGIEADPQEMARFTRACVMFDEADAPALAAARVAWKAVTEAGLPAVYWAQGAGGRWEKKAEKRPDA
ncbi:MAG: DNA polymerase III subunit chi [Neomegalonema sp.]|nr:DNA polymerase III subunit chi [Neomegalonema sp.]